MPFLIACCCCADCQERLVKTSTSSHRQSPSLCERFCLSEDLLGDVLIILGQKCVTSLKCHKTAAATGSCCCQSAMLHEPCAYCHQIHLTMPNESILMVPRSVDATLNPNLNPFFQSFKENCFAQCMGRHSKPIGLESVSSLLCKKCVNNASSSAHNSCLWAEWGSASAGASDGAAGQGWGLC